MRWIDEARFRLDALFRSARAEEELDEEMRAHLEQLADDFKAEGLSETEARRRALREFGSIDRAREDCRESWGVQLALDFFRDIRFGARQLRESKGFALVASLTLALAIGSCAAIFSVLDATLIRALPYPDADRIVTIWETSPQWGDNSVSGGAFQDWRDQSETLESVALLAPKLCNLRTDRGAVRLTGKEVSAGFLDVLGVEPLFGRGFRPEDEWVGGSNRVVILTYEAWRARFGGDESLVGQTILLNEAPHEVIGILPAGGWTSWDDTRDEFLVPAVLDPVQDFRFGRGNHWAIVCGRLKPGVSPQTLEAELRAIKENLNAAYPDYKKDWSVAVRPLQETLVRDTRPILLILAAAVAAVLLIACANVANLLLARGSHRRRELSIRFALGASGQRVARQALTDSLLLSAIGGAGGILLAFVGIRLLRAFAGDAMPGIFVPQLDLRALAASVAIACGAGLLFGCLPAWKASKPDIDEAMKNGGKGSSGRTRSQSALVIAEVALTAALLACAALLLRSLVKATEDDPGFDPANAVAFDLTLPDEIYGGPEKRIAYIDQTLEALGKTPGVLAAGSCSEAPLGGGGTTNFVSREDQPEQRISRLAGIVYCSAGYFESMGSRLLKGRFLLPSDNSREAAPAAVIDERLARNLFADADPVGQLLNTSGFTWEIVGVIADMRLRNKPPADGYAYLPHDYFPFSVSVVARLAPPSSAALAAIQDAVATIDSGVPVANSRSLEDALHGAFAQRRLTLGVIGAFAAAAILLACIGLYGVLSYSIATRERELGIRRALGASSGNMIALVMKDGGSLTAIGLLIGLVGALGAARLLASQLYQVSHYDPLALGLAFGALGSVSLLAVWLPALRATRLDPNVSLKRE